MLTRVTAIEHQALMTSGKTRPSRIVCERADGSTVEVVASSVQFLGRPASAQQDSSTQNLEEQIPASKSSKSSNSATSEPGINISEDELVPDNDVPF